MNGLKDFARPIIAGLLIIASMAVYIFVFYGGIGLEWKAEVNLIIGALIANLTTVVSYYFGSSTGSTDKTAILANIVKGEKQ